MNILSKQIPYAIKRFLFISSLLIIIALLLYYTFLPWLLRSIVLNSLMTAGYIDSNTLIKPINNNTIHIEKIHIKQSYSNHRIVDIFISDMQLSYSIISLLNKQLDQVIIGKMIVNTQDPESEELLFLPKLVEFSPFHAVKQLFKIKLIEINTKHTGESLPSLSLSGKLIFNSFSKNRGKFTININLMRPLTGTLHLTGHLSENNHILNFKLSDKSYFQMKKASLLNMDLSTLLFSVSQSNLTLDFYNENNPTLSFKTNIKVLPFYIKFNQFEFLSSNSTIDMAGMWQPQKMLFSLQGNYNSKLSHNPSSLGRLNYKINNQSLNFMNNILPTKKFQPPSILQESIHVKGSFKQHNAKLNLEGQFFDNLYYLYGNMIGSHDFSTLQGNLLISLLTKRFENVNFPIQLLLPDVPYRLSFTEGKIGAVSHISWSKIKGTKQQTDCVNNAIRSQSLPTQHDWITSYNLKVFLDKIATLNQHRFSQGEFELKGCYYPWQSNLSGHAKLQLSNLTLSSPLLDIGEAIVEVPFFAYTPNQVHITGRYYLNTITPVKKNLINDIFNAKGKFDYKLSRFSTHLNLTSQNHGLSLHADLNYDFNHFINSLNFQIDSLPFEQNNFYINQLFPSLTYLINLEKGTIGVNGYLVWQKALIPQLFSNLTSPQPGSSINFNFKNLDGTINDINFKSFNTRLKLDNFNPLHNSSTAKLSIKQLSQTLNFSNLLLSYQLEINKDFSVKIIIPYAALDFAKGNLISKDIIWSSEYLTQPFTITLNNLQVTDLFQIIELKGLYGTGLLSGNLVIQDSELGYAIQKGELQSSLAGGIISYKPPALHPLFKDNKKAGILLDFLSEFHYDYFKININHLKQDTHFYVQLKGKNPLYYNGIPLIFNLNLYAPIESLMQSKFIGNRLEDNITHRIISAIEVNKR